MCESGRSPESDDSIPSLVTSVAVHYLVLDSRERRIRDIEMPPLLTGELKLLMYLGGSPWTWHSTTELAWEVYARRDPGGRQLVWTYASLLRRKVANGLPHLLSLCRRRGYSCQQPVKVIHVDEPDAGDEHTVWALAGK